jgi:uncharacterized protein YbjT (DUF2867 family)
MTIRTVAVFGASGRQGQAQVRRLRDEGYAARAISRQPRIFAAPGFQGVELQAADYADVTSLDRACAGADAILFQPPQLERPDRVLAHAARLGEAAGRAGVQRVVLNSTMWAPDAPCGQPMYDLALAIENTLAGLGLPLVVFRPTLFMDNWLTAFAKPALVREHVYRYPHKPELRYNPIALDDVARFMVAALTRPELVGQRIRIAGPETLTPPEVAEVLSEALGTPIRYEYQSPRDFGHRLYDLFGSGTGVDRETYVGYFVDFYTFNNDAPERPFAFDVRPVLKRIPVTLETFRAWAKRQDWTTLDDLVGSVSG